MNMPGTAVLLLLILGPLVLAGLPASAQAENDVVVTAGESTSRIANIFGVNCGPTGPSNGWFDLRRDYRWLRVRSIRVHDCGYVGDIHTVFPQFKADATKAENYDFKEIDRLIEAIQSVGASPLYRLGYSWDVRQGKTPSDYDQFALICRHIVAHFTQGWANGYRYGNIEWEVWNEANLASSWTHSAAGFRSFYTKVVTAIRLADTQARVGACGLAVNWPRQYQEDLVAYCATNNVPLDFFSWHYYGWGYDQAEPYDFARQARWVRTLLDRHGLHDTSNYLTEWNVWHPGYDPRLRNTAGAAYCLSALMFMLDAGVDMTHHYRGDVCSGICGGLFELKPSGNLPVARALAFHALAQMQETPNRLACSGGDRSGFAALAGVSDDGRRHQVLLSDFWSRAAGRRLHFHGLKPARRFMQVFDISQNGTQLVQAGIIENTASIEHMMPHPGPWMQLITLDEIGAKSNVILGTREAGTHVGAPEGMLTLVAGGRAREPYIVLGSMSGRTPGVLLPGDLLLPINPDPFTYWLLSNGRKIGYDELAGEFGPFGLAFISWKLDPLDPRVRGTKIDFAAVVLGGPTGVADVSNAVTVSLY